MATRALVNLPKDIRRGDVVEVRTAIAHPMETGYRQDAEGRMLPRDIVRRLEARLDGELVFAADLNRAIEDAERELAEESAADTAPPQPGARNGFPAASACDTNGCVPGQPSPLPGSYCRFPA